MNTIKGALFKFLENQATIAAYVGGPAATPPTIVPRIYPLVLRQDSLTLPCLSYHVVVGEALIQMSGDGVRKGYCRIQISAWSNTRLEADNIIEALRSLLHGYNGLMDDVHVQVVSFGYVPDMFDHISKISHSSCQLTMYYDQT